jgi:adenine-specific DNA methylase
VQKKRQLKRGAVKPVLVGYRCSTRGCTKGNKDTNAPLNEEDFVLLASIKEAGMPAGLWYPTDAFPKGMNTTQPIQAGITSVDKAYTPRALRAMAQLWSYATAIEDEEIKQKMLFTITSLYQRVTIFSEFRFWGGSGNIANYSVPSVMNEQNVFATFLRKAKTIESYFRTAPQLQRNVQARVQSATNLAYLADNSVDYVFTDPPFGSNINYSEMNFLWESWLQRKTETTHEAIVHKVQKKNMDDYQGLLTQAFAECKRVLKPRGWITIVFHNSSDKVWAALQNAIRNAGLQISSAQTFDKQHGTFKQFVSDNAVGYDIMVHCRKEVGEAANMVSFEAPMTKNDVSAFITKALHSQDSYLVKFLHVNRKQEFDYRKLYAELLTSSIAKSLIGIAFDEFRTLVDNELEILASTKSLN